MDIFKVRYNENNGIEKLRYARLLHSEGTLYHFADVSTGDVFRVKLNQLLSFLEANKAEAAFHKIKTGEQ